MVSMAKSKVARLTKLGDSLVEAPAIGRGLNIYMSILPKILIEARSPKFKGHRSTHGKVGRLFLSRGRGKCSLAGHRPCGVKPIFRLGRDPRVMLSGLSLTGF